MDNTKYERANAMIRKAQTTLDMLAIAAKDEHMRSETRAQQKADMLAYEAIRCLEYVLIHLDDGKP